MSIHVMAGLSLVHARVTASHIIYLPPIVAKSRATDLQLV